MSEERLRIARWPQFKAVPVTRGPKGWEQTTITFVRIK